MPPQDRKRGLASGANAYLVKSGFNQQDLLETIEQLLGEPHRAAIAPGFVEGLATWLDDAAKIVVKISVAGEPLRGATAYVAPDALHLAAEPDRCVLLSGAPIEDGFRPSGSFLLRSVAQVYRGGAVGLVLTGMAPTARRARLKPTAPAAGSRHRTRPRGGVGSGAPNPVRTR